MNISVVVHEHYLCLGDVVCHAININVVVHEQYLGPEVIWHAMNVNIYARSMNIA